MQNFARLDQRWRKSWKICKEFFYILIKNLCGIDFYSNFLLYIPWISAFSESIYPWKIRPVFYNNLSDFRVPHPDATEMKYRSSQLFPHYSLTPSSLRAYRYQRASCNELLQVWVTSCFEFAYNKIPWTHQTRTFCCSISHFIRILLEGLMPYSHHT